jgi:type I restriction enzyme, S subunit
MQELQKPRQGYKFVKSLFGKYEEIPLDWDFVALENLVPNEKSAIRMGPFGSSLKKHELIETDGIKTLWIENIINNILSWDYRRYITKEKYEELKGFTVKPDDIVITMMGTLGRAAIIPEDIGIAIISSHLLKITLTKEKCLPQYLYYYILSKFVAQQLVRESRGLVMEGLDTGIIKSILVKLPPIQEQQKIFSILSKVDELIQKIDQAIEQTQRLKKGLMQKLLTKGIGHTEFRFVQFYPRPIKERIPSNWRTDVLKYIIKKTTKRDHNRIVALWKRVPNRGNRCAISKQYGSFTKKL